MSLILIAKRTFQTMVKGERVRVRKGDTAHEDHPVVKNNADAWAALEVKYAVESKPAAAKKAADGDAGDAK